MKSLFQLLIFFSPFLAVGQTHQATLLGHWDDESLVESVFNNPYHDVWGAVVNDREIGIITSTNGFHFFDLSDDNNAFEPTAYAPGTDQGAGIAHRDVKTYLHYAYGVADEGSSALQVIDMSNLPESVEIVYDSNEFITTCHNIFIDEDNARLYAVGGNGFNLRVLSLVNPEQPQLLTSFPNATLDLPYIHDLYVRDNIGYLNAGDDGFIVVDFSDPLSPEVLGTMPTYVNQGYNHSGWLSHDDQYFFLCDETHGADVKVLDVSDLEDIEVIARTNANSTPNQIAHNTYLLDNLLYISYYYDGLQVFDVSNPRYPRRIAEYDTHDGANTNWFAGAWGVFVLPSGRVLISDMNIGLFYFEALPDLANYSLTANLSQATGCVNAPQTFTVLVGSDFEDDGISLSAPNLPAGFEVSFSNDNPAPGEEVEVNVTPDQDGTWIVGVQATDGINTGDAVLTLNVIGAPEVATLNVPTNGNQNAPISPVFLWDGADDATSKKLQISTDSLNFEANIIHEVTTTSSALILQEELTQGTQFYWRIVASGACGDAISEVFTFTTRVLTDIREIQGNTFALFPNPATHQVQLTFSNPLEQDLRLDWFSAGGQHLRANTMQRGAFQMTLTVGDLPAGIYWLRMASEAEVVLRKIIVE